MKSFFSLSVAAVLGGGVSLLGFYIINRKDLNHNELQNIFSVHSNITPVSLKASAKFEFNENSFVKAAESTVNSVVHVKNMTISNSVGVRFFSGYYQDEPQKRLVGTGSGVIITPDGYIITNNHVIDGASDIEITLNDNQTYQARLVGSDIQTDIALLKIETDKPLPYLSFADSDNTKVGEWVLAVGNPFNLNSTVTAGIISAKARNISNRNDGRVDSYIQTDAVVNMGNSGGALVNLNGDLIGINTAISSNTGSYVGYSFALPSNIAKKVVEDLMEFGNVKKGVLGVRGVALNSQIAEKLNLPQMSGFYVASVDSGSGAEKSGIRKGDIIKQIDKIEIHSFSDMSGYIASKRPNDTVKLLVERGGKSLWVSVILTQNHTFIAQSMGWEVKDITDSDRKIYGVSQGVKITKASTYYNVYGSDIYLENKVLVSVNGQQVRHISDLEGILSKIAHNDRNLFEFVGKDRKRLRLWL